MKTKSKPQPLILLPSNLSNDRRGEFFERFVATLLRHQRYRTTERVRLTGMEVDILAVHKDTQQRAFVECKFIREPFSADVVDKLLGKALRRRADIAMLFATASPGREARGAIEELRSSVAVPPLFAFIGPEAIVDTLLDAWSWSGGELRIPEGMEVGAIHIVITPDIDPFWAVEVLRDGLPAETRLFGRDTTVLGNRLSEIEQLLLDNDVLTGRPVEVHKKPRKGRFQSSRSSARLESVVSVLTADSLVDYRPCRPQDYVGREELQRQVWSFLERVRRRETSARLLALSGPSGFGKSSTVVKLSDRFRNVKWRKRVFLHSIDTRAAEGPLFVSAAVKAAFDQAIAEGFITTGNERVSVTSNEGVLQSPDILECLEFLAREKRVVVLFFDQFEEMLYKQDLQSVFRAFKGLAFETASCESNLVLGFSWRTGITIPDGNAAYHTWHSLADLRVNLRVDRFVGSESSRLVALYEKALGQKLLKPLRNRLIEQGQGIPWLLKKLCIHVYRELMNGVSQYELLERRLNIGSLFEEDLLRLPSDNEVSCLRFIAENSPVALNEVAERFGESVLNTLYESRLVIRVGQKYAVYWDVFRDYLIEGEAPRIPWAYVPVVSISMALKGFELIQRVVGADQCMLAEKLGYAAKTVLNIVGDLQNFALIEKAQGGGYSPHPDLRSATVRFVAQYLHGLFKDHIAVRALTEAFPDGSWLSSDDFGSTVTKAYLDIGVPIAYARRYPKKLRSWLRFAGHLDNRRGMLRLPTAGPGDDLGVFAQRTSTGHQRGLFLGTASARSACSLAIELGRSGTLKKERVLARSWRNAAADLCSLGLAKWNKNTLEPIGDLARATITNPQCVARIVAREAATTFLVELTRQILASEGEMDDTAVGEVLGIALERPWSRTSKKRNGGAAKRWVRFVIGEGF